MVPGLELLGTRAGGLFNQAVLTEWLLRIGIALLIAGVGMFIARALSRALERVMTRVGVERILSDFLRNLAYAICVIVVGVAALDAVGVPTTSLLAVLGAAGLAIGLALKDSLSNIASGVMLIVLRPFRAGDSVLVAGQEGTIEQVRIFQTVLRTAQNHLVILPNSQITASPIVNFTSCDKRRIDLSVVIGYRDDLSRVRAELLSIATGHASVLASPAPDVAVAELLDTGVKVTVHAWTVTADYAATRSDLAGAIQSRFASENLAAMPPRELHVFHRDAEGRTLAQIEAVGKSPG